MRTTCFSDFYLVTIDPPQVERGGLRVEDGVIVERGPDVEPRPGDDVVKLAGGVLTPGLVVGHHHLYSALARGMNGPPKAPQNFVQILERVWWVLDRVLDPDTVYWCGLAGLASAVRCGVTGVVDHHASPGCSPHSLDKLAEAFEETGQRGLLCYETSDRAGANEAARGVEENARFLRTHAQSRLLRGAVGAHASFTLSDETLEKLAKVVGESGAGIHIHVLEDEADRTLSQKRWGADPITRLARFGLLNENALLVHGVHLNDTEIAQLAECKAWLLHNGRSNMNNNVGRTALGKMEDAGVRLAIGTDGIDGDVLTEARVAFFRSREEQKPPSFGLPLSLLGGAQRVMSAYFGKNLHGLAVGSPADLTIFEYPSTTPFNAENLAGHLYFGGLGPECVHSVMVDGRFVLKARTFETLDTAQVAHHSRKAAAALWKGMQTLWDKER